MNSNKLLAIAQKYAQDLVVGASNLADTVKTAVSDYINTSTDLVTDENVGGKINDYLTEQNIPSTLANTTNAINATMTLVESENIYNESEWESGYVTGDGRLYASDTFIHHSFAVSEGDVFTAYYMCVYVPDGGLGNKTINADSFRFITAYDREGNVVTSANAEQVYKYTVPNGVTHITISVTINESYYGGINHEYRMIFRNKHIDEKPFDFVSWQEPYYTFSDGLNAQIQEIVGSKEPSRYIRATGDLAIEGVISLEANHIKTNKHLVFTGNVTTMGEIHICNGYQEYGASYIVLDATTVKQCNYTTTETVVTTSEHGLTIGADLQVCIDIDESQNAKVRIGSQGEWYEMESNNWSGCNGTVYVKSIAAEMTDCVLSCSCDGYWKDIHLYGDSYFSAKYDNRWIYYLVQDGFADACLIDGYPGKGVSQALTTFQLNITHSKPKYAVWCLGMNNNDSDTVISATWKTYTDEFLNICDRNGIIPILATIPTVKGGTVDDTDISEMRVHKFKNAYVRESGRRYIDFDLAVGASEDDGTWYEGMLADDGVHPNTKGAKALYMRVLADFPEIMQR